MWARHVPRDSRRSRWLRGAAIARRPAVRDSIHWKRRGSRDRPHCASEQHLPPRREAVNAKLTACVAVLALGVGVLSDCGSSSAPAGASSAVPTPTAAPSTPHAPVPAPAPVPRTVTRTATTSSAPPAPAPAPPVASSCVTHPGAVGSGYAETVGDGTPWDDDHNREVYRVARRRAGGPPTSWHPATISSSGCARCGQPSVTGDSPPSASAGRTRRVATASVAT